MNSESYRLLAGGALAALILPLAVLLLGAPAWAGLLAAALVFVVVAIGGRRFAPQRRLALPPPVAASALAAVMAEAGPALDRLEEAAPQLRRPAVRERAMRIALTARAVLEEVEREPAKLPIVQRLLTYYLPGAAEIADGYARLEAEGLVRQERVAALEEVLVKLEDAFARFAQRLVDEELKALELEIQMVEQALREDLGAGAGPQTGGKP